MNEHVSGITVYSILDYLRKVHGVAAYTEVLKRVPGLHPPAPDDLTFWVEHDTVKQLYQACIAVTGDDDFPYHVGRSTKELKNVGILNYMSRLLSSPKLVYRMAPVYSGYFTKIYPMEVTHLTRSSAVLVVSTVLGITRMQTDCDYARGVFESIPTIFGLPPATVKHVACACKGHPACIYEVRWQPLNNIFKRLYYSLVKQPLAYQKAVEALQKQQGLLAEKNLQIEDLHQRVLTQIKERTDELTQIETQIETQRKRFQDLMQQREQLVHMIVHDLKNPLQGIFSSLSLLDKTLHQSDDPKVHRWLQAARVSSDELKSMIGSIIDVSSSTRPMQAHLQRLSLRAWLLELWENYSGLLRESNIKGSLVLPEVEAEVDTDPMLLRRLIENFMSNAIRHTPSGGEIHLSCHKFAAEYAIAVINQGRPIDEAIFPYLFQPYHSTQGQNGYHHGLGLAFCRMAAKALGGTVGAENLADGRVRFWVSLPYVVVCESSAINVIPAPRRSLG